LGAITRKAVARWVRRGVDRSEPGYAPAGGKFMKNDEWFRSRARELYHEDGEIEVDSNALVSAGDDDGAYVQAWVWVPLEEE
jgi:hypothetical protein